MNCKWDREQWYAWTALLVYLYRYVSTARILGPGSPASKGSVGILIVWDQIRIPTIMVQAPPLGSPLFPKCAFEWPSRSRTEKHDTHGLGYCTNDALIMKGLTLINKQIKSRKSPIYPGQGSGCALITLSQHTSRVHSHSQWSFTICSN